MSFTKYDVKISEVYSVVNEPIIKSDWLHRSVRAKEILSTTEEQCQQMLDETKRQCELLVQQTISDTESQVWDKANQLLAHWDGIYRELCDAVELVASDLVLQALHRICADFIPEERVKILLLQLIRESTEDKPAKLFVHPTYKDLVLAELQDKDLTHWQLLASEDITAEEMMLSSSSGTITASISVASLRQHIDDKANP